jgi:N-acetylglucosaminyl-diphospho-decaprenol L-rhamnosyltransferase
MNSSGANTRIPDVTVIIVSFNTVDMTLKAISTLLENAGEVALQVIVWDNASHDGSADAVAEHFPQVELIRSADNIGFGQANNAAAERARADWILLLNSDTETFPGAVEQLLAFAREHPQAGIVGGRTLYADGKLNPTSCFNRMTVWSLFVPGCGVELAAAQFGNLQSGADRRLAARQRKAGRYHHRLPTIIADQAMA